MSPGEDLPWKDRVRDVHGKWWYIVRKDTFLWEYWNETTQRFVGSFYASASKFRTKEKAEKFAFLIVSKNPHLISAVGVHER